MDKAKTLAHIEEQLNHFVTCVEQLTFDEADHKDELIKRLKDLAVIVKDVNGQNDLVKEADEDGESKPA